mmetsp:Transcript_13856/g.39074  ORF Transcript_13856/g.39074 Transcript_13856/m.39074 type:complete len:219 (-) Transcript_13856:83-739(-)
MIVGVLLSPASGALVPIIAPTHFVIRVSQLYDLCRLLVAALDPSERFAIAVYGHRLLLRVVLYPSATNDATLHLAEPLLLELVHRRIVHVRVVGEPRGVSNHELGRFPGSRQLDLNVLPLPLCYLYRWNLVQHLGGSFLSSISIVQRPLRRGPLHHPATRLVQRHACLVIVLGLHSSFELGTRGSIPLPHSTSSPKKQKPPERKEGTNERVRRRRSID